VRIKLDENLPVDAAVLLVDLGHDVDTVVARSSLAGSPTTKSLQRRPPIDGN
jgi:hypothetical protein